MAKGEKKIPEWILSAKEEKQLSPEDKMMYYKSLREYCRKRKLVNTTFGATVIGPKLKNVTGKICAKVCKVLSGGTVEVVTDGLENIPEDPVIFARVCRIYQRTC